MLKTAFGWIKITYNVYPCTKCTAIQKIMMVRNVKYLSIYGIIAIELVSKTKWVIKIKIIVTFYMIYIESYKQWELWREKHEFPTVYERQYLVGWR